MYRHDYQFYPPPKKKPQKVYLSAINKLLWVELQSLLVILFTSSANFSDVFDNNGNFRLIHDLSQPAENVVHDLSQPVENVVNDFRINCVQ